MKLEANGSSADSKKSNQPFLCYLTSYEFSLAKGFSSWSNKSEIVDQIA